MDSISFVDISDRSLKRLFIWSSVGHLVLLLSFITLEKLNLIGISALEQSNIRLAQASVRVDIVAMPKYTIKELKAMSEVEEEAPAASKIDTTEKKAEAEPEQGDEYLQQKKKKDFMSMLKDLSKQNIQSKNKKPSKKADTKVTGRGAADSIGRAERGRLDKLVVAGNKLSSGTSLFGSGNAEAMDALDRYATSLPDLVRAHWKLPSYLLNRELTCRLKLFISRDGDLLKVEIYESSGDQEYDSRAIQAVQRSAPFPALPSDIQGFGTRGAIVLGFPL